MCMSNIGFGAILKCKTINQRQEQSDSQWF